MAKELILGLDVGTSSVKGIFIDLNGIVIRRVEIKIKSHHFMNVYVEQDAEDYLLAIESISKKNTDLITDVVAIGLSGQTPSVVCTAEDGSPVRPVLIWQDNRSGSEADELTSHFGNPMRLIGTSLPWAASACPAKMLWLSRNEEKTVSNTRWILQPKDFVGLHLTGTAISDPWSSKGLCNVKTRAPIEELFDFVGWDKKVMPQLLDGFASRGKITKEASSRFNFNLGVEISVGWSDAMCGMAAMGVLTEPGSFVITGTSAIVGSSSHESPSDASGLYIIPNTCAPMSVTYGPTQSSGAAIAWASELFNEDPSDLIDSALGAVSANIPIFLPYISGERAPLWRSDIRGGLYSINAMAGKAEIAAAVMEGVSFAEKQVVELAEELIGFKQSNIRLGGHAGNDIRWEKIRHRTLGRAISRYEDIDITTRGSAMLAHAIISKDFLKSYHSLAYKPAISIPLSEDLVYSESKFKAFLSAQEYAIDLANKNRNRS